MVPLLATRTFHLAAFTSVLTFILAFGAVKAITNFFAGTSRPGSAASRCWSPAGW